MKRFGYFEKLSLAARWFLPQDEAESVIDDYRDILSESANKRRLWSGSGSLGGR